MFLLNFVPDCVGIGFRDQIFNRLNEKTIIIQDDQLYKQGDITCSRFVFKGSANSDRLANANLNDSVSR